MPGSRDVELRRMSQVTESRGSRDCSGDFTVDRSNWPGDIMLRLWIGLLGCMLELGVHELSRLLSSGSLPASASFGPSFGITIFVSHPVQQRH